ncbi:MAG: UDP-N-acetylmuramate dehydrogenase [Actinomycetota bacterium]
MDAARAAEIVGRLGPAAQLDVPIGPLCTYRVGGDAAVYVEAESVADLELVVPVVNELELDTLVVGRGSNLLVADAGFDGVVVKLGDAFEEVAVDRETGTARLAGGALLPVAARRISAAGLTGFEWAVGVPGSAGGAVRMNAGGHGSDMAASVTRASVFDLAAGGPREWSADELAFGYRRSSIGPADLVLYVELQLEPGVPVDSSAEISEIVRWRRANQPGGQNAGSVFTNPDGDSAGRMIDAAGLKGFRVGTAEVSTKHANFIQADRGGSADDVRALIVEIRRRIWEEHGVVLHVENLLIGFEPLPELVGADPGDGVPR